MPTPARRCTGLLVIHGIGEQRCGQTRDDVLAAPRLGYPSAKHRVQTANQEFKAVAFVFENRAYPSDSDFADFIRPIDWIEERTGLNFMPGLDSAAEQQLESQTGSLFE